MKSLSLFTLAIVLLGATQLHTAEHSGSASSDGERTLTIVDRCQATNKDLRKAFFAKINIAQSDEEKCCYMLALVKSFKAPNSLQKEWKKKLTTQFKKLVTDLEEPIKVTKIQKLKNEALILSEQVSTQITNQNIAIALEAQNKLLTETTDLDERSKIIKDIRSLAKKRNALINTALATDETALTDEAAWSCSIL